VANVEARFQGSAVGTNAGVTVTQAAPSDPNDVYCVLGIQCSGDAACIVTIESPSGTIIYRKRFAAAFTLSERWAQEELMAAAGQAVLVKVSASTSNSEASIQGSRI